jgi:hypothetical protein
MADDTSAAAGDGMVGKALSDRIFVWKKAEIDAGPRERRSPLMVLLVQ